MGVVVQKRGSKYQLRVKHACYPRRSLRLLPMRHQPEAMARVWKTCWTGVWCITYPAGRFCYDLSTLNLNVQGGFYLSGRTLYELELDNGTYYLEGLYTRN